MARAITTKQAQPGAFDLLRVPLLGRFLKWRHARTALQVPLLIVAAALLHDGFAGPQLAPKNLAGVVPWVQWRGFVVLALLIAGNLFCMACPFMLPRKLAKRLLPASRAWPRPLRSKWLAAALLVAFFWAYEGFNLWASPLLTAWVILAYFLAAFVIDGFFKGAAFCKYVCPIGQFNFVNSLISPLEVKARDLDTCTRCTTKDCIAGHFATAPATSARPGAAALPLTNAAAYRATRRQPEMNGCELWLFQEKKVGNMDCTFCLDCVHACPHDNVGIIARAADSELWQDPRRSGIGLFSARTDLAALVLVLVFGAFFNAFGMVGPVYPLEQAIAGLLGTDSKALVLLALVAPLLILLPLLLVGAAAWLSRLLSGSRLALVALATRYSYMLAPLGFGMWLAHYSYHFLTGALTIVPVAQNFLQRAGLPLLGAPNWTLGPVVPNSLLVPIELLFLDAGLLLVLWAGYNIARREQQEAASAWAALAPWAGLAIVLFTTGVWLLLQPMEMRGTLFGSS